MDKNQAKKLMKLAIALYVASFLIINWNDISWIFNYKEVSGLIEDFFNPYPTINASTMDAYFYPNHSQATTGVIKDVKVNYTPKVNTIEIPKINISVPIIFSTTTDKELLLKDLDQGVVYYPGSVLPGQIGAAVILGHSAPPGWPTIKHDWVFTDLQKLSEGDLILIDVNGKQYTYKVKTTTIIKRGGEIPTDQSATNTNVLTLVSCWPPGKDYQRIAVQAEIIK
jgi:sortase A